MAKVNRLLQKIFEINAELKSRPGDQRRALTELFSNPDPWVRFNAASAALDVATAEGRVRMGGRRGLQAVGHAIHLEA